MNKVKLFSIKQIVILEKVNWSGRVLSKFSIYEFIFSNFIVEVKKHVKDDYYLFVVKTKSNDFISRIREKNKIVCEDKQYYDITADICFILFLESMNHKQFGTKHISYCDNFFLVDYILFISNYLFMVYDNKVYVFNNSNSILLEEIDEKNLNEVLFKIFKESN